jgi:hypothetical protein
MKGFTTAKVSPPRKPRRVAKKNRKVGNPTYARFAFTVAGQRRIFTDFPNPIDYLLVGEINH